MDGQGLRLDWVWGRLVLAFAGSSFGVRPGLITRVKQGYRRAAGRDDDYGRRRTALGEVRRLTATELVVNLKERGYRPEDDPRVMLVSLRDAFKRHRGRFSRGENGKWKAES